MKKIINVIIVISLLTMLNFLVLETVKANDTHEQLYIGSQAIKYSDGKGTPVLVPKEYKEKDMEFRGVWIATVWNIDMPQHTSQEQYKQAYRTKLDVAEQNNLNAILFQTRGMNDTYYESAFAPFSKTLTGTEGGNPGWDIMEWVISETHSRGMELHFWMNPYRVSTNMDLSIEDTIAGLHDSNFAKQRPDLVIKSGDAYVLNPGEPEVQEYIKDVIDEAVELYPNVDGIHFDDYFYFGDNTDDQDTFTEFGKEFTNIEDFRRASVDKLIEGVHLNLKAFNEANDARVMFGISPSGIYKNGKNNGGSNTSGQQHYYSHYIDTVKWIKNEWLDYITPQIYWQFSASPVSGYADLVSWWVEQVRGTNVKLIIGHSLSDNNWNNNERTMQILYNSQYSEIYGSIFYSHRNLNSSGRMENIVNNYWKNPVKSVFDNKEIQEPNVEITGTKEGDNYTSNVSVEIESDFKILYKIDNGHWQEYTSTLIFDHFGESILYVKSVDSDGNESIVKSYSIDIYKENNYLPEIVLSGENEGTTYFGKVVLTIKADPNAKIEYYVMNGLGSVEKFIEYTGPVELSKIYVHRVVARTMFDNTPSEEVESRFTIKAEKPQEIKPTLPSIMIEGEKEGIDFISDVQISFDELINGDSLYYRLFKNGKFGQETKYTGPITINDIGLVGIEYYVKSITGHKTEVVLETFEIKDTSIDEEYDFPTEVVRNGKKITDKDGNIITLPSDYTEKEKEIRAIWFSTVSNIDLEKMSNIENYKRSIQGKFDKIKENNYNTIFFQVRPMNDAFYYSDFAPHSRYITGIEGTDPGFDVLEFVVQEAHKRGLELHAWLNPYRVATGTGSMESQLSLLSDDNFAKKNPNLVLADSKGALILNPGEPAVQEYLGNVVQELVTKYAIDGIHFDDYFYSYSGTPNENDRKTYNENKLNGESQDNWRRRNVDIAVESVSKIIRENNSNNKRNVKFGISPFGIWRNRGTDSRGSYSNGLQSFDSQYADSRKWVIEKWVDYITPQLYWAFDNFRPSGDPIAPFADLLMWWYDLTRANGVGLVVGLGLHNIAEEKWKYQDEIIDQLRYISKFDGILGSAMFTYSSLQANNTGMQRTLDLLNNYLWKEETDFSWDTDLTVPGPDVENSGLPGYFKYIIWGSVGVLVITGLISTFVVIKKKKND